jgi:hypothetical protein
MNAWNQIYIVIPFGIDTNFFELVQREIYEEICGAFRWEELVVSKETSPEAFRN